MADALRTTPGSSPCLTRATPGLDFDRRFRDLAIRGLAFGRTILGSAQGVLVRFTMVRWRPHH